MNFAPFAFQNQAVSAAPAFLPTDIGDLTFWIDFNDATKMNVTSGVINSITSSFVSASGSLQTNLAPITNSNKWIVTGSLSQPSLNTAYIISQSTTYGATNWNTANNDNIVQGPKSNTTSYPDGMTFMVLNRTFTNQLGYLLTRFDGSTDRGAFFTENRPSPGSPQLEIGVYDYGVSAPQAQNLSTTTTGSVILTRQNSSAVRTVWNGAAQVALNNGGNDQQNRTFRQFHNVGRYGTSLSSNAEQPPIGTYFCELIQYNRVLTSTERTQVWNYLSNKWNIPIIVDNGLQLYLDAGIVASYPGTGTAWNDLSGKGNNLTLVNGPTWSSANGGYFTFDGTNDYVSNYTYGTTFSANEFTYQAVLAYSGKTTYNNIFDTYNSVNPMMWIDPTNKLELNQAALVSALAYNTQNIMVTFVQQNANPGLRLYVNDTLVGTVTTAQGTIPNSRLNFFRRETSGQYYQGRVYSVLVYNKVLTSTEITQNYNAFKTRFPI